MAVPGLVPGIIPAIRRGTMLAGTAMTMKQRRRAALRLAAGTGHCMFRLGDLA